MSTNENAAEVRARAASDTAHRSPNHTDRKAAAQCLRNIAASLVQSARDDSPAMISIRGIEEKRLGLNILKTSKAATTYATLAIAVEEK